jgi:hypothetical protein
MIMENVELVPNKSYGKFVIGGDISKYLYLAHTTEHRDEKSFSYDSYDFYTEGIIVWTDHNKIDTIRCDVTCYWKNHNLIGMLYDNFLILAGQQPDREDMCYVPINSNRGQNQKVYSFYILGIQVWVWRNKIKTVLISTYNNE